jgi:hypothetical protein
MKPIKLVVIAMLCSISSALNAQNIEYKVGNDTYVYDSKSEILQNKKNFVMKTPLTACKYFSIRENI